MLTESTGDIAERPERPEHGAVAGLLVEARDVGQRVRAGRVVLSGVSLRVEPGGITAVAGSSGAGKSVLLETLAGIRRPAAGQVLHDGAAPAALHSALGFVPQEDIIHLGLPLARTLEYAARLRMPRGADAADVAAAVSRVLTALGLTERAGQRVGSLSGGERKRAGIAVELLTRPRVLFLDEPTSGLDPATGAELMSVLRRLAGRGTTVVLTTHTPADLLRCDTIAFLSPDGRPAYTGPPGELCAAFGVTAIEEVYAAVAAGERVAASAGAAPAPSPPSRAAPDGTPSADAAAAPGGEPPAPARDGAGNGRAEGPAAVPGPRGAAPGPPSTGDPRGAPLGALRQWALLSRRGAELLLRDRLSLAVLVGSPLMIVAMFAVLFEPGAFDPAGPNPGSSAMILFWIAFGGFFFGLAYGLPQICMELPVVRRERLTVLRLAPYVLSKLTVLLPVLAAADALLLAVLRALDRLPAADWAVYGSLFTTTLLASAAALALGLLASAAVSEPAQATLMLPLLCFPQVLFSGAFVPVPEMAWPGRALSWAMTNRWAFEGLGSGAGLEDLWRDGGSPLGPPLLASYGASFRGPAWADWAVLGGVTVLLAVAAWAVLARRCRRAGDVSSAAGG